MSDFTSRRCPFCLPDEGRVAFAEGLIKGIWDAFPVTEGHLLLTPHRHIATWSELHSTERAALIQAIDVAQRLLMDRFAPDGFNVGFNEGEAAGQTIPHFHVHVIPRRRGDIDDPRGGVRHVIPEKGNYLAAARGAARSAEFEAAGLAALPHARTLIAGGEDALIRHLIPHIDKAARVDVAVSFAMESGVRLLRPHLQELLDRDGIMRFLTGDYLDVTDPDALRRLMDLEGRTSLMVFETGVTGFHPKSWIFHFPDGSGVALVGSSNLSAAALHTGVEWNYRVFTPDQQGGWRDVLQGFEDLIARPEIKPLTHAWIDTYEKRRVPPEKGFTRTLGVAPEQPPPVPLPHEIQERALRALEQTRVNGYTAGMVVLATGLGKTWLSAFDSSRKAFGRVLFVAHREEILTQALETYRICRPHARLGRYSGAEKDLEAAVLFASIQTLSKVRHLRQFAPDAFDYIVVDEFHHAAARTYRALIEHFTPKFLLGLTATPDRMDGGDLMGLCQENLVFRCDALEGIEKRLLSPFRYYGVPDAVDYTNIPWRGAGFDEAQLTFALATEARAQNAFEQHQRLGGRRTLAFCCSQRHADFMSGYFTDRGLRTASVHAGSSSDPRATSLERLQAGELDAVFAVDMFNEGVDVPEIDTVLMLRPTESTVIWMQQFGRGLRRAVGKDDLTVVDYIGNHRIFLNKARALLNCGDGDRALRLKLEEVARGRLVLPPGCDVIYELEALDMLQRLLRPVTMGDAFEAYYLDFKERTGERPRALDMLHAGFKPNASGHGRWFDFVRDKGDLDPDEVRALASLRDFLNVLATTQMTRSYKMQLLQAMRRENAFPGEIGIDQLTARFIALAARHPTYRVDVTAPLDDARAVRKLLEENPIDAWINGRGTGGRSYFSYRDGVFRTSFLVPSDLLAAFSAMVDEIIDWRLAEYLERSASRVAEAAEDGRPFEIEDPGRPELWREYMREEIPSLFSLRFNTGSWNQGFVVQSGHAFLLVTLDKSNLQIGHQYVDGFVDDRRFRWSSQTRTKRDSGHGRILNQTAEGYQIHLFVRGNKIRGQKATPFIYCGDVDFESWEGDSPISVTFRLRSQAPERLQRLFQIQR